MAAMKNKLPTFNEWLEVRDVELVEALKDNKFLQTMGLLGGLAASAWGANKLMNRPASPAADRPAMVASADPATTHTPYGTSPRVPVGEMPKSDVADAPAEPVKEKIGKTIMMKGGRSGYATVKATLERPLANTWVFHVHGHIEPNSAIKQARAIAMNEMSARRPDGFQVQITPTDEGMDITVRYAGK